jgi:hypothetical protein
MFWLARLRKAIPNEPQIKDVCAQCNNGVLSELDQYICKLFEIAFLRLPARHENVVFEYDYHLLKRWLLKLCFNSARLHNSRDLFALRVLLPYVLGQSQSAGRSTQLFVQLAFPELIPDEDLDPAVKRDGPVLWEPTLNRVGQVLFRVPGVGKKLLRMVGIRSFIFYLAFYDPNDSRSAHDDFADVFVNSLPEVMLLRPSKPTVTLVCDGTGAWASFRGSQSTGLAFDPEI